MESDEITREYITKCIVNLTNQYFARVRTEHVIPSPCIGKPADWTNFTGLTLIKRLAWFYFS